MSVRSAELAGAAAPPRREPGPLERWLRGRILRRLGRLAHGRIELRDGQDRFVLEGEAGEPPLAARLTVRDPEVWRLAAVAGTLGFAEAYLRGQWDADDLVTLLRVFARNIARRAGPRWVDPGPARFLARRWHARRRNTRDGSRANIRDHYDLGNGFFRLFLDETMTYSAAWFDSPETSLRDAQIAKLDRICGKLALGPDDHVLEIGTGWGSFAIHAAGKYGCRVTTTTISAAQRSEAEARVRAAGLADRIEILGEDYRALSGRWDKLVSIEMIEAVGREDLGEFFGKCAGLVSERGAFVLQGITMPDRDWDHYVRNPDFIQLRVFPGSSLVSLGSISTAVAGRTDFRIDDVESLGAHYATTLRIWRERFLERREDARALGHDEKFLRLWEYYLAYCEAAFAEAYVDDLQIRLTRPGWSAA